MLKPFIHTNVVYTYMHVSMNTLQRIIIYINSKGNLMFEINNFQENKLQKAV